MNNIQPTPANIIADFTNPESGELEILYFPGHPKVIIFDATKGVFCDDEKNPLTAPSEPFIIHPIAFRLFQDNIFGMGLKKWAEFFFLNEEKIICSLLVHSYSVDELMSLIPKLYYQRANICEVALSIKPEERTSKTPGAAGKKFFICMFSLTRLSEDLIAFNKLVSENFNIWREASFTAHAVMETSRNYKKPVQNSCLEDKAA
jgi:hypothetical protein